MFSSVHYFNSNTTYLKIGPRFTHAFQPAFTVVLNPTLVGWGGVLTVGEILYLLSGTGAGKCEKCNCTARAKHVLNSQDHFNKLLMI